MMSSMQRHERAHEAWEGRGEVGAARGEVWEEEGEGARPFACRLCDARLRTEAGYVLVHVAL